MTCREHREELARDALLRYDRASERTRHPNRTVQAQAEIVFRPVEDALIEQANVVERGAG